MMSFRTLSLVFLPLIATVGCHKPDPREITAVSAELQPVVDGANVFAWEVYQASRPLAEGNLFYSPFSMVAALSMVYAGAEGETEAQLAAALSVSGSEDAWHNYLGALVADLSGEHWRPYTIYTANKLWGQVDYPFEQDFLDVTADEYQAPLEEVDFQTDAAGAREEINGWVSDQTQDRIPELFSADDINNLTRLVLANAIYFLADWAYAFEPDATQERTFTLASGDEVQVPLMEQTEEFGYAVFDGGQVLEMTYESDEMSMVVVLPDDPAGLSALEDQLSAEQVDTWLAAVHTRDVHVRFPSFQMETVFPLVDCLKDLGVVDAWDEGLADFSGMLDPGFEHLWLYTVVHKAFVRVDEEGTEAAAATGAVMAGETSAEPDEPPQFFADRPFLFFIRDRLTGTILFTGRMTDPSAAPLQD